MKKTERRAELRKIRDVLTELNPGATSHQAGIAPNPEVIFAPSSHANALDPDRMLVVGNRGVGKSFWSAVLAHAETRTSVAKRYSKLRLDRVEAALGFYEDAGKSEGPAPSQQMLKSLIAVAENPEDIWRAVLLRAIQPKFSLALPDSYAELISWSSSHVEETETLLRDVDAKLKTEGKVFLLVFDALDRLGRDWNTISKLSEGLLRFALDVRGFRAIRAKIFMRTDQANDDNLFRFADASKIRADAVKLVWQRTELFGLLFKQLMANDRSADALRRIGNENAWSNFGEVLLNDEEFQESMFYDIAGEYMGAGAKRGRTYSWLFDHLADAFGETSPRSFLTALKTAANHPPVPIDTAIDHNGIRAGVQNASQIRVSQLKEEYDWIDSVLKALEDLEVPCDPSVFKKRWVARKTAAQVRVSSDENNQLLPLELERSRSDPEEALLLALKNIGVVEYRNETRINMPDIFRVAAGIKRRGGVRPPQKGRQ